MQKLKKIATDALAMAMLIILTLICIGLLVVGLFYLHNFVLDLVADNCYTNMFGEVICKVMK